MTVRRNDKIIRRRGRGEGECFGRKKITKNLFSKKSINLKKKKKFFFLNIKRRV